MPKAGANFHDKALVRKMADEGYPTNAIATTLDLLPEHVAAILGQVELPLEVAPEPPLEVAPEPPLETQVDAEDIPSRRRRSMFPQ